MTRLVSLHPIQFLSTLTLIGLIALFAFLPEHGAF